MNKPKDQANADWYNDKLELVTEVQRATPKVITEDDGSKTTITTKKPTLTDAKKLGLIPRTSSIIKRLIAEEGIVRFRLNEQMSACIGTPFMGDPGDGDQVKTYKSMITAKAEEYKDQAANRGREMHACLNRWVDKGEVPHHDPISCVMIEHFDAFLCGHGVDSCTTEQTVGGRKHGRAGTPDLWCVGGGQQHGIDLKSKSASEFRRLKTFTSLYLTYKLQLGDYAILTNSDHDVLLWQAIVSRETGEVRFVPYENEDQFRQAAQWLFEIWCVAVQYDPRTWEG